ncbi:MAG TPA: hypothetical protein VH054_07055, partial [Polyangiaceae bacterium]|nr:hypothetical protein [Polyangiaceae bacterium]
NPDASVPPKDAGPPRLDEHDGSIMQSMQLGIVYVGDIDAGAAPNDDIDLKWLLGSPYWLNLEEYGITNGNLVASVHVPTSVLVQPSDLDTMGRVDVLLLQSRIATALGGDSDAGTPAAISMPGAQAYLFFLPDGLNVALGQRGSYTYQTCVDTYGYHGFDGVEPYAVLPPCDDGRSLYTASHELAEMATDPEPYTGWASDSDISVNGGEVADLCEQAVMQEGVIVTRLWSNMQNGCVP